MRTVCLTFRRSRLVYPELLGPELPAMPLGVAVVVANIHTIVVGQTASIPTCLTATVRAHVANTADEVAAHRGLHDRDQARHITEDRLSRRLTMVGVPKGAVPNLADNSGASAVGSIASGKATGAAAQADGAGLPAQVNGAAKA